MRPRGPLLGDAADCTEGTLALNSSRPSLLDDGDCHDHHRGDDARESELCLTARGVERETQTETALQGVVVRPGPHPLTVMSWSGGPVQVRDQSMPQLVTTAPTFCGPAQVRSSSRASGPAGLGAQLEPTGNYVQRFFRVVLWCCCQFATADQ